jgi:hypothetical protein
MALVRLAATYRMLMIAILLILVVIGCSGFYSNAWAAWAPPGEANPNHAHLVFASRFFGIMATLCLAAAAGMTFSLLFAPVSRS